LKRQLEQCRNLLENSIQSDKQHMNELSCLKEELQVQKGSLNPPPLRERNNNFQISTETSHVVINTGMDSDPGEAKFDTAKKENF